MVLEKTFEGPLDSKEIKPVNPKENQLRIFIQSFSMNLNESTLNIHSFIHSSEAQILWPPAKSWLIGKDPDAGKIWQQEKGATEDEIVGYYHQLNGHEFEENLGDIEGQERLACFCPWGCKELDTTEQLNNIHMWWNIIQP